jgi:endo-1,4-beta-D-glucanase Y
MCQKRTTQCVDVSIWAGRVRPMPFRLLRPGLSTFLLLLNIFGCGGNNLDSQVRNLASPLVELAESWKSYCATFIQKDGRVIDRKGGGISTSEGQAYAMLRATWMRDRIVFDKTYTWARNNLNSGIRKDHLWAWKWGQDSKGRWQVLDKAFASDADEDAALALILAYKTWNEDSYLTQAREILTDLWDLATVKVGERRFLLAGDTLCQGDICRLNPSYYAPYAYRIFKRFDQSKDWMEMVDSSYFLLEATSRLSKTHLPPDWVQLDRKTGNLGLASEKDSNFSYDAFRVYWRIALDSELFQEPRARKYLTQSLYWIANEWKHANRVPAVISKTGKALAEYESPEMLAGLLPALQEFRPDIAAAMHQRLQSGYRQGVWFDKDSYYIQNWVWFGIALYQRNLSPFKFIESNHSSSP